MSVVIYLKKKKKKKKFENAILTFTIPIRGVIYAALCFDVAQGQIIYLAPNGLIGTQRDHPNKSKFLLFSWVFFFTEHLHLKTAL